MLFSFLHLRTCDMRSSWPMPERDGRLLPRYRRGSMTGHVVLLVFNGSKFCSTRRPLIQALSVLSNGESAEDLFFIASSSYGCACYIYCRGCWFFVFSSSLIILLSILLLLLSVYFIIIIIIIIILIIP